MLQVPCSRSKFRIYMMLPSHYTAEISLHVLLNHAKKKTYLHDNIDDLSKESTLKLSSPKPYFNSCGQGIRL